MPLFLNLHTHTENSNYRLLDCINKAEDIFKYSKSLGHNGVAITDHETVGASVKALHTLIELKEKDPEYWSGYKLILGNEIYLCNRKQIEEEKIYKFPHFILLAKNVNGHKAIRELSTIACVDNAFVYVHQRVPTYYDNLVSVMKQYKGDVIASTACMGGTLPQTILSEYYKSKDNPDFSQCVVWINKMQDIFGKDNFFLELQPSVQEEQDIVNKYLIELANKTDAKYIITTDAHYLKKEDRPIHEAFLKSQEADRETGDFYATTYLMSEDEIHEYLDGSLGKEAVDIGLNNTQLIYDMCEDFTLDKPLNIPYIPDNVEEPDMKLVEKYKEKVPLLEVFAKSNYDSDRHLVREIVNAYEDRPEEFQNEDSYNETQICLNSIKLSSDKQNTPWSAYLLQTKELIKICWESGSLVGPLRGSAGGFFLLYLLGIIQVNKNKEDTQMFHWRLTVRSKVS